MLFFHEKEKAGHLYFIATLYADFYTYIYYLILIFTYNREKKLLKIKRYICLQNLNHGFA